MKTAQRSRVGVPSGGSRWWYPIALFVALLSLLVALVLAGAGNASAGEAVALRHTADAVPSMTAISLIPATSSGPGAVEAGAFDGPATSITAISLIPATSSALAPVERDWGGAVSHAALGSHAAFGGIEPAHAAERSSAGDGGLSVASWLMLTLVLIGGAAVLALARPRRLREH